MAEVVHRTMKFPEEKVSKPMRELNQAGAPACPLQTCPCRSRIAQQRGRRRITQVPKSLVAQDSGSCRRTCTDP